MRRKALFGSATVLSAVLALPSGCNDTRRDWDVCNSEICQEGFKCNAAKRCVPIPAASVDSGVEGGRADGSAAADALDSAADGEQAADVDIDGELGSDGAGDADIADSDAADSDTADAADAPPAPDGAAD
jgi:hypothetical protein